VPDDDPFRLRSPTALRAFQFYLHWYLRRNFDAVRVAHAGLPVMPAGRPMVIYSNHPSWWDPVIFILLAGRLMPDRVAFGPMDATSLQRYPIFRKLGVFGIDPRSPAGAHRFLKISTHVLSRPDAALWVTAQGAFVDSRQRPLRLRPGIAHLARRSPQAVMIPLALEYPFWNERQPEALAHFGPPIDCGADRTVAAWTAALEAGLVDACETLAAASMARDPHRFVELIRGRAGVGGTYDLWRRMAAMLAGRPFNPSHEARR
jgi:1-acyl-sn-glycerol-3-phosphate acyltransferase